MIVRTPDGKWAIYSPALRILTRVGLDERDALSAASEELGSIDKARAALADVESWDAVLRLMDEPTRKALARRYGVAVPPPAPAVRRREENAAANLKAVEARERRAAAKSAADALENERRRAEAKAKRDAEKDARAEERLRARAESRAPRTVYTPEERDDAHRVAALAYYHRQSADAAPRVAAAAHKRAQRVAAYLLFGTYSRAANLCGGAPDSVRAAVRAAGVAKIEKRTPLADEVERTMRNFGFDEKAIKRALKHAKP